MLTTPVTTREQITCLREQISKKAEAKLPNTLSSDEKIYLINKYSEFAGIGAGFTEDGTLVPTYRGKPVSVDRAAVIVYQSIDPRRAREQGL